MAESTSPTSSSGSSTVLDRMPPVHLPDLHALSEAQTRGKACVWCAVTLAPVTAVDLGERDADAHGSLTRWFPRSCRECVIRRLYRVQLDHTQSCEQCADNPALCETGRRLRSALKTVRR
ncbi:hypothetical protein ACIBKX_40380 [Streptomyces sp. NPDC050658]|uniref:hypothetical protein n=1 Tax=unclassified Streptomyces TaxID=2593676 RepID=UPI0034434E89